jgi:transcriptional regulator of acetoin/glycerol metabolism
LLAQQILSNQSTHSKARLDPSTFRVLVNHSWPGNLRELRAVLLRATLAAGNDIVYARDLPSFAREGETVATGRAAFPSERDWILDALRRHRYRRTETARFLGLSRKTLYNKICAYELYPEGAKSDRS